MQVNVKRLDDSSILPTRGSKGAAGLDLYARLPNKRLSIESGETALIGTGIALEIPEGFFGAVFARSGLASKRGLRPANCVGVIDEDYRGEIIVPLHNDSKELETIEHGDKIAQIIILPYVQVELSDTGCLSETARGSQGFGSTGT